MNTPYNHRFRTDEINKVMRLFFEGNGDESQTNKSLITPGFADTTKTCNRGQ